MTRTDRLVARQAVARTHRWLVAGVCLVVSAGIALVEFAARRDSDLWTVDLAVYRAAGDAVRHGLSIYEPSAGILPFTYPPFAAVAFAALVSPSVSVAIVVWNAGQVACLIAMIWLCLRHCGVAGRARLLGCSVGLTVLALPLTPIDIDLVSGQVNIMLMVVVLWDLLRSDARGQGIAIGLAAGLKLTPLIFVVYLVCTGRIRQALLALGAFAATIAVSFAVLPSDSSTFWFGKVFDLYPVSKPQSIYKQSLRSVLSRLLGTTQVNGVWLVVGSFVGVLGIGAAVLVHRRGASMAGACICALTGLLVSPVSWEHHWVWIVPTLIVVGAVAWRSRSAVACAVVMASFGVFTARLDWWGVPQEAAKALHLSMVQQLYTASFAIVGLLIVGWLVVASFRFRTMLP
ncbi:glycosyltransferase 87 family protein [Nocardia sp. NPDC050412]|uniref:glycosyltransferase 87 family protein n=1 Tax=Nocardia sp. NPDC050412 TaxID=3364320 RepID=UPI0037AE795D